MKPTMVQMSQAAKMQSLQSNLELEDRPPFHDKAKQFLDYEERASFVSLESKIKYEYLSMVLGRGDDPLIGFSVSV